MSRLQIFKLGLSAHFFTSVRGILYAKPVQFDSSQVNRPLGSPSIKNILIVLPKAIYISPFRHLKANTME